MLGWLMGNRPKGDSMNASIRNFLAEEDGITALEYGILACIVAAALIAGFQTQIAGLYTSIMTALSGVIGKATGA
jgi:pilus assembly protein Flp/PilA